ncbi:inositol hexakisphosphate and diphosphoinositol-pentakisphosphate kinase 1-like [Python bivittatus]|uniref:Inositol hexakisphosphate and diphosphoinositol-pentakisphosphate kinase 1-like n=1 Tax=Python bivittatus TaxID=176946 RepID=A0A9F2R8V3_PYTBI|nr:inositol hexakisphosphate and diphosphoinositol-pentakisphosphate kinase 1-like [Python bivittatus]
MVPSIYPLETLHNCLSLRQVSDFLTALSRSCHDSQLKPLADGSSPSSTAAGKGPTESLTSSASCFYEDQVTDQPSGKELLNTEEGSLQGFTSWGELLAVSEEEVGPEQGRLEEALAEREEQRAMPQSEAREGRPWGLWDLDPDPDELSREEV